MNVSGIVLHPAASQQLDNFLRSPTHAVLLSGHQGSGKTIVAAALAAQLLGVALADLDRHAYYRLVAPEKGGISIEQVRELTKFFRLKVPGEAAVARLAIIQDAELMGVEAQNALLKLLEEPPLDSVLILTSSQAGRLLPTIRSRTQILQLPSPDAAALRQHFMTAGYTPAAVSAAVLRAGTNVAEAERILQAADQADSTVTLVKQALGGATYDRLLLVDGPLKPKEAAVAFVDTLATIALASLEAAAAKGAGTVSRWQAVLAAAHLAQESLAHSGNVKLVMTELMLAL